MRVSCMNANVLPSTLKASHPSKVEKKSAYFQRKLLSNVVIFPPRLAKSGNVEGHALETLHEQSLRGSSPLPWQDIYFPDLCTGCPADGIEHPL